MTYDPKYNRVYIGTGNGSPWNDKLRSPGGGDNLFLCSVVALDADTGEYVWHYQTTPGESWNFNSTMDIRSEEHTSELQSLMSSSYAVLCLKKKNKPYDN